MAAGTSAHYEAQRSFLEAEELDRLSREARRKAACYELAARTEAAVGARLAALEQLGWKVLADRRWAGSRHANVDFLLVGPGGIVVVDVKAWRALQIRGGSLFCDDECRDDDAEKLLDLSTRVHESLTDTGLVAAAIHPALVFAGRRLSERAHNVHLVGESNVAAWVTCLGRRLDSEDVERLAASLAEAFPSYDTAPAKPVQVPRLRLAMPRKGTAKGSVGPLDDALIDVDALVDALVESALAEPIEGWMTFLHPDQRRLVTATWNGPARIRGTAGTGKTVVALHRATHLADKQGRQVLFVTYVRTLPVVLAALAARLAPHARDRLHFMGLHRFALDLLDEAGIDVHLDRKRANTAFSRAWAKVGRGGALTRLDERWSYWREEIDYVIKGRGLTDWQEYVELARSGRRTPMRTEHREAMWDLYVEYERLLDQAGCHDFNDVLIMARDAVIDGKVSSGYESVIVDEVQDLPLVGLQLLHAVAGEGTDRFLIIGDGQQSIYPGGFTLSEAGVSVTGRATVLKANYRNASAILEHAAQVIANDSYEDIDGASVAAFAEYEVRRSGGTALTVRADDQRSLDAALTKQILDTRERLEVPFGDMAVLTQTLKAADHYRAVLTRQGIPWIDLLDYDGITCEEVKVGTFKRSKGLEFKFVLLPGLVEGSTRQWSGEAADSYRERAERERRELFVAMTRARDGLWLGYLPVGGRH